MVGGPWAWHQSGHRRYIWHSYTGLFTLKGVRAEMIVWAFDVLHLSL